MEKLKKQLDELISRLNNSTDFKNDLRSLISIYPFSQYEYIISNLFSKHKITFEEYLEIRSEYTNRNLFLPLYEITAPRAFGDTWALGHLMELEPELKRPLKKFDSHYKGEYDLYLFYCENKPPNRYIKIEVKASRLTDRECNDEPIYIKALASDSSRPFLMNFQQLKPRCSDVFIWIAVCRDKIKYWVINSKEIQSNRYLTPQHRSEATAKRKKKYKKASIYEGQIMMTDENINYFNSYLTTSRNIKNAIIKQFKIQTAKIIKQGRK